MEKLLYDLMGFIGLFFGLMILIGVIKGFRELGNKYPGGTTIFFILLLIGLFILK